MAVTDNPYPYALLGCIDEGITPLRTPDLYPGWGAAANISVGADFCSDLKAASLMSLITYGNPRCGLGA